jgi:hypothetical protein
MDFILQRAKAAAAILAAGIGPLLIKAVETASGFDVPTSWELWLTALLTGLIVHQVPNKTV